MLAPLRSAPYRSVPYRSVRYRLALTRFALLRTAWPRLAQLRSAPYRLAPLRFALPRLAQLRSTPLRSTSLRSVPLRLAFCKSMRLSLVKTAAVEGSPPSLRNSRAVLMRQNVSLSTSALTFSPFLQTSIVTGPAALWCCPGWVKVTVYPENATTRLSGIATLRPNEDA